MSEAPLCNECGQRHWNFVSCTDTGGWATPAAERERRNKARNMHGPRRPRPDGLRDWGDDLPELDRIGGNSFGQRRTTPITTGRLVRPGGNDEEAA